MSVILKTVKFNNMFSYGANCSIDLDTHKIVQLTAENGSGKTSIVNIVHELLYNKNVKGIKKPDILNRYANTKEWSGEISFKVNDDDYLVKVSRKTSSKVALYKNGKDISEHKVLDTYKKIQEIIGRDFEVFSQLTYQSSTNLLEFLKATDSNRKKFLINLFGLSRYLEIGDSIKLFVSEADRALSEKRGELKSIEAFIEENPLPERADPIEVPLVDENIKEQLKDLKKQLSEQKHLCDLIDKNNLYLEELNTITFSMNISKPERDDNLFNEVEQVKQQIQESTSDLNRAKRDLKNLDLSDKCYACGQSIDNSKSKSLSDKLNGEIESLENRVSNLKAKKVELDAKVKKYNTSLSEYNANEKAKSRFTQLSQLINRELPAEYPDYNGISKQIESLTSSLEEQQEEHNKAVEYNSRVKTRNSKIDALKEQINNFKVRQELTKNDILKLQDKVNNLKILRKAFSTSGIVAYKIESVAKQLEDSINQYLAVLSDGQFQVIFRLDGEKLNIVVINNAKEVSIDSLSGGEFSRVQTSVLLAVRNTLSKLGKSSINLLFLDEITGVLDEQGKERLFEVLSEEKGLNVFLISHDYSHPLIPKIEITKTDNISYIAA